MWLRHCNAHLVELRWLGAQEEQAGADGPELIKRSLSRHHPLHLCGHVVVRHRGTRWRMRGPHAVCYCPRVLRASGVPTQPLPHLKVEMANTIRTLALRQALADTRAMGPSSACDGGMPARLCVAVCRARYTNYTALPCLICVFLASVWARIGTMACTPTTTTFRFFDRLCQEPATLPFEVHYAMVILCC